MVGKTQLRFNRWPRVKGVLCRKTGLEIVTVPRTQSRRKYHDKDKANSNKDQAAKLNIVTPESCTH